jgi:hypothetical protein
MIRLKKLALIGLLAAGTTSVFGQTYWENRFSYDVESPDLYRPSEFSLDLFGTYADHDHTGENEDRWGGGLGLNFFFTRMVGISVDTHMDRWKLPQVGHASLIIRFPSGFGFAPYGMIGAGRDWDIGQWSAHAGGGLELRLNRYTGLFADGRAVFPEDTPDYAFARAGLRIAF